MYQKTSESIDFRYLLRYTNSTKNDERQKKYKKRWVR